MKTRTMAATALALGLALSACSGGDAPDTSTGGESAAAAGETAAASGGFSSEPETSGPAEDTTSADGDAAAGGSAGSEYLVPDDGTGELDLGVEVVQFGETYEDRPGSSIVYTEPEVFEPSADAEPIRPWHQYVEPLPVSLAEGLTAVRTTVTYTAGADESQVVPQDLYATSGAAIAIPMVDPTSDVVGFSPTDRLEAGESITFTLGFWVEDPSNLTIFDGDGTGVDRAITTDVLEPQRPGVGDSQVEFPAGLELTATWGEEIVTPNGIVMTVFEPEPYTMVDTDPHWRQDDSASTYLLTAEVTNHSNGMAFDPDLLLMPVANGLPAMWGDDFAGGIFVVPTYPLPGQTQIHQLVVEVPQGEELTISGNDWVNDMSVTIN